MPPAVAQLRIVIVSDALTGRNGVDGYYRDLAWHLRRSVARIELINPDPEPGVSNSLFSVPMPGDTSQRICVPAIRRVLAQIRTIAPHVIIIPAPGPFGMLGVYAARRLKVPIIAGLHTDLEQLAALYWNRYIGTVARSYLEWLSRRVFRHARTVVVNADNMLATAQRLTATPAVMVGTPLAPSFTANPAPPAPAALRSVCFAGRLAPEKNIESLLEAAALLPEVSVTLAGSGPLQELVQRRTRELANLHYVGRLDRDAVAQLLDRSDVLVLPSTIEAFGTIALEGMARNRAVLVSQGCGIVGWPALRAGLFVIETGESVATALLRLKKLGAEHLRETVEVGHRQALQLHADAITRWLELCVAATAA